MSFKITKWCLPLRKKWKHRLLVCDAAPLLLLTLLLLCSSCELCCASTRTSPGCLLVLLQHLSCSCIGSACCCFCCALLVQCTLCFNSPPPGCWLVLLLVLHCRSTLVLSKTCALLLESTLTPVHSFTTSTSGIPRLCFSAPATALKNQNADNNIYLSSLQPLTCDSPLLSFILRFSSRLLLM